MTTKRITVFLFLFFAFSSCKKEEEQIIPTYNERGEFFSELMKAQNVKKVRTIRRIPNATSQLTTYIGYSFPGNNFMRLWQLSSSGDQQAIKNYNLDRVIWYEIDEEWENSSRIKILSVQFDE